MTGVTANLSVRVQATLAPSAPIGQAQQNVNELYALALAAGTGIGRADTMYAAAINIAASGSLDLDLTGTLHDEFGATIALADVQAIYVEADAANTNNIVVGGKAATTAFVGPFGAVTDYSAGTYNNPTIAIKPGGVLFMADPAGWPVVATTGDLLHLANSSSGSAVTGKIVIIGRSA